MQDKHKKQLTQPFARDLLPKAWSGAVQLRGVEQTRVFHETMGMPVGTDWAETPSVSHRLLRGKLLIEEVLETLHAMGLGLVQNGKTHEFEVYHIEGSKYCPIETADGLADIKVIANGTAVAFGIPQTIVDLEVWASNMTKLDENGKPIVNQCNYIEEDDEHQCDLEPELCNLIDESQPIGKVLKPATYVKANIARLFVEHTQGEK